MHRLFAGGALFLAVHLTVVSLVLTATQAVGQQLATDDSHNAWLSSERRRAEVAAQVDDGVVVEPGMMKRRKLTERPGSSAVGSSASDSATDRAVSALRVAMRSTNAGGRDSSSRNNGFRGGGGGGVGIPGGRSSAREQRQPAQAAARADGDPRVNTGTTDDLREVATKVLTKLTHALQLNRLTQAMNAAAYLHDVLEDIIGSYGPRDEDPDGSRSIDSDSQRAAVGTRVLGVGCWGRRVGAWTRKYVCMLYVCVYVCMCRLLLHYSRP